VHSLTAREQVFFPGVFFLECFSQEPLPAARPMRWAVGQRAGARGGPRRRPGEGGSARRRPQRTCTSYIRSMPGVLCCERKHFTANSFANSVRGSGSVSVSGSVSLSGSFGPLEPDTDTDPDDADSDSQIHYGPGFDDASDRGKGHCPTPTYSQCPVVARILQRVGGTAKWLYQKKKNTREKKKIEMQKRTPGIQRSVAALASRHSVSRCFTLFHAVSLCFTLFHSVSRCFTLFHAVSRFFTPFYAVLRRFTLFHAVLRSCRKFPLLGRRIQTQTRRRRRYGVIVTDTTSCEALKLVLLPWESFVSTFSCPPLM